MEKWAKVFYVFGMTQVLATKDFDQDGTTGPGKVNFTTRLKGTQMETSIDTNNIDAFFEDVDQEMAKSIFTELTKGYHEPYN